MSESEPRETTTQRTFVALHVPEAVTKALVDVQESLKQRLQETNAQRGAGWRVRWIVRQQMHVTVCFLGDTGSDRLEPIRGVLAELAHDRAALRLQLGETLSVFGSSRRARALVAPVVGPDARHLAALQRELAARLQAHGFQPERRPYIPHITLARVKPAGDVRRWLVEETLHLPPIPFLAESMRFYSSTLTSNGGVYSLLDELPF